MKPIDLTKRVSTIGLEIHVELSTLSKMFCGCPADHFAKEPNTQTCPVCLGLPGALPVPNKKAVDWTILIGLALNCKVNPESKFDRKHYFYPDLPKGYQISQYDDPLCRDGFITTSEGKIRITRVHLEEDTGKLLHRTIGGKKVTLVDFNRSGVPLVEIVTEPDIHSGSQAKEFAQKLQSILRTLKVSECDMEKGTMRLEANISWGIDLGYKVEIKNLNSFRFVERAINYELKRQRKIIDQGDLPAQETRGWNEKQNKTVPQRYKETAADYRYFPEPDIPPLKFSQNQINNLRRLIPELPQKKLERLYKEYKIRKQYLDIISVDSETAVFAEQAFVLAKREGIDPNQIAGMIVNKKINIKSLTPDQMIRDLISKQKVKISDEKMISIWVKEAKSQLPQAVKDYRAGKKAAIAVLIGKVMQLSGSKADPQVARIILEKQL